MRYPVDLPVFYTADLHLNHGNILLYCGRDEFMSSHEREMYHAWMADGGQDGGGGKRPRISRETVMRHDDGLLAQINSIVPTDGVLAIVGDFCFGRNEYYKIARRFREAIKCQNVHLIWGNHDRRNIADLFSWTNEKVTVKVGDHKVVLDHEAHYFWDCRHHGARHYYGHTHGRGENDLDLIMPGRFSIDVGVDNVYRLLGAYRPFSDIELEKTMKERSGFGLHK